MIVPRGRPIVAARARGAALIVLMALLTMGVLYFIVVQLEAFSGYAKESRGASDSLAQAREALLAYAATYRDDPSRSTEVFGYLPCPDTSGKTGIQTPGDGEAAATCGTSEQAAIGLLPYKTLGLPDLRDSSGVCLWYAVAGGFKNNPKTTRMNWDTQGQFTVLDANGATLVTPEDAQGGAAAVVFATGLPLAGQSSRSATSVGPCQIDPAQVAAFLDGAYTFATTATIALTQGPTKDANGIVTNNDRLAWITPKEIFDRVIARQDFSNALTAVPPGQINTLIDRLAKAVEKKIQDDIFDATSTSMPSNTGSYTPQPAGAAMGDINATAGEISLSGAADYTNYLSNWSDQLRQIRCNSVSAACLDINNSGTANCRGALLFAGRTAGGQPRTGAQKAPSIANLASYFESGLGFLTSGSAFGGRTAYAEAVSLSGSSWSGGTVTVTTSSAHGFGTDSHVAISGVSPSGYNGIFRVAVTDATHFTFPLGSNPGVYVAGGSAYSPSADVVACLGFGTYDSLKQSSAAFSSGTVTPGGTATSVATVTGVGTATPTIVLGSGTLVARSGCVWRPTPLPLNSSLRLYFTYTVASASAGQGFTLALADAATNNPSSTEPVMCGATGTSNLGSLGYSGAPVSGSVSGTADITGTAWTPTVGPPPFFPIINVATITTAANHGFATGNIVTVSGTNPSGYDGTYSITVTSPTQFTYVLPTNPGPPYMGIFPPKIGLEFDTASNTPRNDPGSDHFAFVHWGGAGDNDPAAATRNGNDDNTHNSGVNGDGSQPLNPRRLNISSASATPVATVAAARWSGGTASISTAAPHGFTSGQSVTLSDISPLGYKGTYTVTVGDATHFTYAQAADPGKYPYIATVSAASWASGTATITTPVAHGLATGDIVTLSNMSPTAWNGSYSVTVIDTTHFTVAIAANPGAYVAGGQVSAPLSFISAAAWSGGRVSVTTSSPHGLISEQFVTISGASPSGYNGTYRIRVSSSTQFSYFLPGSPGVYSTGGTIAVAGATSSVMSSPVVSSSISSGAWASSVVTVTTSAAHGLGTGQAVQIAGVYPAAYNGAYAVTVPSISNASWAAGTATIRTAQAHGLSPGQAVIIAGINPAGYNGTFSVTNVMDATHLSVALVANPGVYVAGGQITNAFQYALATDPGGTFAASTFAYPGIATVKAIDPYLPYAAIPTGTTIHVRLDISRGYDASRRQATLTLRAYVGDTFTGDCAQADFKNFARDLAELCPVRSPTVEQDGLVINDAAGPALAKIYLGFTTARRALASNNETINIQNLILRSQ